MTIDTSGDYPRGTEAADLAPFLEVHLSGGLYPMKQAVEARCACGSLSFEVALSDNGDAARRACARCGVEVVMLDSADRWDEDADYGDCSCPCEGEVFEVAVGMAPHADGRSHDIAVALRCVECGILGVYAEWEIEGASLDQLTRSV